VHAAHTLSPTFAFKFTSFKNKNLNPRSGDSPKVAPEIVAQTHELAPEDARRGIGAGLDFLFGAASPPAPPTGDHAVNAAGARPVQSRQKLRRRSAPVLASDASGGAPVVDLVTSDDNDDDDDTASSEEGSGAGALQRTTVLARSTATTPGHKRRYSATCGSAAAAAAAGGRGRQKHQSGRGGKRGVGGKGRAPTTTNVNAVITTPIQSTHKLPTRTPAEERARRVRASLMDTILSSTMP
jgi:hypothetical protein